MKAAEKEALRWFLQAKDDFKFVEWVLKESVFFDKGCFLSQQAGEKIIKACLYATGKRRVIGHSLFEMINELTEIEGDFSKIVEPAKRLDRFYITTRYPNGLPGGSPFQFYTLSDLESAFKDLSIIFDKSEKFLKRSGILVGEKNL
jgi:HEPN domain-containing protein